MKPTAKSALAALGGAILIVVVFSGCQSTGSAFDGTQTASGPQNTTFTVPDNSVPAWR